MNQNQMKQQAANAALEYIKPGEIIGVGTGSTTNFFIDALATIKGKIKGTVASSETTADKLRAYGIEVFDLNQVQNVSIYVDSADEFDKNLNLVKGGGGALTREKIVAAVADKFICIADESKLVGLLGNFPLPVEAIPMARSYVAREIVKLTKAHPVLREGFTTDNGNIILDINALEIIDPPKLETEINQITGVVTNGLFARRKADILLLATPNEVKILT